MKPPASTSHRTPAPGSNVTLFHACQSCIFYVPLCPLQAQRPVIYSTMRKEATAGGSASCFQSLPQGRILPWAGKVRLKILGNTHTHTHTEDSTLDEQGATLQKKLLQSSNISNKIWSFIICSLPEILPLLEDWFAKKWKSKVSDALLPFHMLLFLTFLTNIQIKLKENVKQVTLWPS